MREGLKENTSLRLLDLSRNRLGARTAEAFAASLRRNCTLRVLKLGWNVLGTPGTSDVIRSLSERQRAPSQLVELRVEVRPPLPPPPPGMGGGDPIPRTHRRAPSFFASRRSAAQTALLVFRFEPPTLARARAFRTRARRATSL